MASEGGAGRRRRGEELENSILEAVWAELTETGYTRLTMEGVAARAQTGKQVLYRRWPSRPALVLAAVRKHSGSIVDQPPDTGTLRGDALVLLTHMAARQRELGTEVARGILLDAVELDPDSLVPMSELWVTIVRRAVERGEIGDAPVPERVVTAAGDLLRYRLFVAAEQVTDAMIEELVDEVFLPLISEHARRS